MKQDQWLKQSRGERVAQVVYPDLTDEGTRKVMNEIAGASGKRGPQGAGLIPDHKRGAVSPLNGVAKRGR